MAYDKQNSIIVRTAFNVLDQTTKQQYFATYQSGAIPAAYLVFSSDASNNDTIGIGGHTFKFLTTLGAASTFTQVKRGTSAAATRASLVNAINGVADTTTVQATTPFAKTVVADQVGTSVRIRWATARGGTATAGVASSIALTDSLTPGADIWNCSNLNKSGKAPANCQMSISSFTIDSTMITNGSFAVELPFTPTILDVFVTSSAGVLRASNEAVTSSGGTVTFTMAGGASPNLQSGDIVTLLAMV